MSVFDNTIIILTLILFTYVLEYAQAMHPEILLNFEERVKFHGYPVETHEVITDDGYILNLFRIRHGYNESDNDSKNKSVVLLVHGIGGSPQNFIALGKKEAAAFYFADRGFDVWLFCSRGVECQNSKKHVKYDWNKDPKYWDFSFHDIGVYDIPACIDHITNVTGQQKLFYIGHSAGGPEFYAMISERPEYNNKIKITVNYASHTLSYGTDYPFFQTLCSIARLFKNLVFRLGFYELTPPSVYNYFIDFIRKMCADPQFKKACKYLVHSLSSSRSTLIEDDITDLALNMFPRLGVKQLYHFMDNVNRGDFRKYDYGPKKNKKFYGQQLPPLYNLSACSCANAFFYGATDTLNVKEDAWKHQENLENTILDYEVGPQFTNLDFILAKNASQMLYEPTVKLFKDFDEGKVPPKIIRKKRTNN